MGNHKFRLSDMMPNAWFHKLKDMNKPPNTKASKIQSSTKRINHSTLINPLASSPHQNHKHLQPIITPSRASYYFPSNSPLHPKALDTHFPIDSPRKSTRKPRKKPISSRNSTSESESTPEPDIIFDVAELHLPPIITKPRKNQEAKPEYKKPSSQAIHRLRLRANSPKVRLVQRSSKQRKGLSGSVAVVKNSSDPKKDFRESMMEMITENDLRASKDLEELLACYLSLNSNEYHDVIVKVFEEIWFDITDRIRV